MVFCFLISERAKKAEVQEVNKVSEKYFSDQIRREEKRLVILITPSFERAWNFSEKFFAQWVNFSVHVILFEAVFFYFRFFVLSNRLLKTNVRHFCSFFNCSQNEVCSNYFSPVGLFLMRFFAWPIFRLMLLTFLPQKRDKQVAPSGH